MFDNKLTFYKNKNILVTGHTGFKGSWLCLWLKELGANITGISLKNNDNKDNLFELIGLERKINSVYYDLTYGHQHIKKYILDNNIEIIFHLAAQPLVFKAYKDPLTTFNTNVMGTINLLEAIRQCQYEENKIEAAVIITTDKCYEANQETKPYCEEDKLGGHDPYSASKAMAEIAAQAYYKSFLKASNIGLATARAGNVIGGGDFAKDRLIPDLIDAITNNEHVIIRSPHAVRPWQYVLDALYGYLLIGEKLSKNKGLYSTSFNFSPSNNDNSFNVEQMIKLFISSLGRGSYVINKSQAIYHETNYLKLNANKAKELLGWQCNYNAVETMISTSNWYNYYLSRTFNSSSMYEFTMEQINHYMSKITASIQEHINI